MKDFRENSEKQKFEKSKQSARLAVYCFFFFKF